MKIRMINFPWIKLHLSSFYDFKRRKAAIKEPETVEWLQHCLHEYGPNTLIDIGANVGGYSLISCSLHEDNRSIAIEPFPPTFLTLCKNINSNGYSNQIFPVNGFFGTDKKGLMLNFRKWKSGIAEHSSEGSSAIRIGAMDSDYFASTLEGSTHIIVKIDVDGGEFDVLAAANNILQNPKTKSVLIECDIDQISDVESHLLGFGFTSKKSYKKQNQKQINIITFKNLNEI